MKPSETAENSARRRYWEGRLLPLRLDSEPILNQLEKRRSVVVVLSTITSFVVSIMFVLFAAFGRPDIGAILGLIFVGPILSVAWFDFFVLRRRVNAYLAEMESHRFD